MGFTFPCCSGGAGVETNPTPNRPVIATDSSDVKQKRKTSSKSQTNPHLTAGGTTGLSTADEKRNVFELTADGSGPSSSSAMGNGSGTQYPVAAPPAKALQEYSQNSTGIDAIPSENPPPYHNWQEAVPDTSILPPPPVQAYLYSNTGNALTEDADRAHDFCDNTPLWTPYKPSPSVYDCVRRGDLRPVKPNEYNGSLTVSGNGRWRGRTRDRNGDCILLTSLPVYFPAEDSPLVTERTKTIYFEIKLLGLYEGTDNQVPGFSIGFAAQPYPTWRSPGWERGSVGVFSDDGCRFVNDTWGGREFTTEFEVGETVGLGMIFSLSPDTISGVTSVTPENPNTAPLAVEIFFTRNGQKTGSWNLHEEVDEDSGDVKGLEGDFDMYGAVGLFGGVEFETCFDRSGWMWLPPN